ncbi:hypothetical protein QKU48_gp1169 [Fadolivirus algeromassiliense]|jgi:hypothetical protein|uniref:Uncharacterized protein n=1 Tax=Fadolivirus FV1/VV64 TaxID=3070911 RepID=A0A7D3QV07_9VIRU|nr:hypothetical protein QKU48_gp1169 [Fadolivirus algeromassiliense]QKF94627.1 hypothetical protein Fadolivirus_1_1169 [Fadolivirus FV1/VV64]
MSSNVLLFPKPKNIMWLPNVKTILFDEVVCLDKCKSLVVDCNICAEISNLVPPTPDDVAAAYNTYTLYIDGVQVDQAGFEAETDKHAPNIGSASLMWSGSVSCRSCINVKVTTQLTVTNSSVLYIPSSNVTNALGTFKGAKGAKLRVMII